MTTEPTPLLDEEGAPNVPGCTCDRDDQTQIGDDLRLCEYHQRVLGKLSWATLASMVVDLEALDAARSRETALDVALTAVAKERARQDGKWGEQNHDATVWLAVLTEEVGELADAILERRALLASGYTLGPAVEAMRHEAVQVAAVAVAIIEWMDRGTPVEENAAAKTAAVEIAHHEARYLAQLMGGTE